MRAVLFILFIFFTAILPAENIKLIFSDGDISLLRAGHWTLVEEGVLLGDRDILRLEPSAKAVLQTQNVKIYLTNNQGVQRLYSLEKVLSDWKSTQNGQNALAARLDLLVGGKVKRDTANMGVRSMSEKKGVDFGEPASPANAEDLWSEVQTDLDAGRRVPAEEKLNRILDLDDEVYQSRAAFALADLLWKSGRPRDALTALGKSQELRNQKEGIFLYAQLYMDTQDWDSLNRLVDEQASKRKSPLADDQKQALIYFQYLAALAQEGDPQPYAEKIIAIDPASEWAQAVQ